jgi:hypothetical protein
MWAAALERRDRSWVGLLVFLLTVAIGLLAVVAYRLREDAGGGGGGAEDAAAAAAAAVARSQLPVALLTLLRHFL